MRERTSLYFDFFAYSTKKQYCKERYRHLVMCSQHSLNCVIPSYRGGITTAFGTCYQWKARENYYHPVTIGFGLTLDWLKGRRRHSDWLIVTWLTRVFPRLVRRVPIDSLRDD